MIQIRKTDYADLKDLARIDPRLSLKDWYLYLGNLPREETLNTIYETELKKVLGYIESRKISEKEEEINIVLDENSCVSKYTNHYVLKEFIKKPPRKGIRRFLAEVFGSDIDKYTAFRNAGFEAYQLTEKEECDKLFLVVKMSLGLY